MDEPRVGPNGHDDRYGFIRNTTTTRVVVGGGGEDDTNEPTDKDINADKATKNNEATAIVGGSKDTNEKSARQ
jgi:hypothetical protein